MGGAISKKRWGKSIMDQDNDSDSDNSNKSKETPKNQQSFIYRKLKIDENFPTWLQEMFKKHGPYNSPEKLEINKDLEYVEQELDENYFFLGFTQNKKKHGYGVMLMNEIFYEGCFEQDVIKGWGRQLEPTLLMEGYWENNQIVKDKLLIQGNKKYQGQFINNTLHGKGTMTFDEEDEIYEGDFDLGIKHGKGIMKNLKYDCQYDGDFQNNKMEGNGILLFGNGMEYEGDFFNNQMHGKGYLKYPDGKYYKGEFLENKMHGKGILKGINDIYDGEFQNGLKHGYGKMIVNKFEIVGIWVNDVFKEETE
ncbi:unnamed protein product [Paramecium primaurelia]|uniref:MORN repeat protein n=1 Tax=Paramecium primaurelia TaxID=5886 RepID=A0A8S1JRC0_PARPR|nr:unnamed protein product [Paramecium primaurelia]